MGIIRYIKEEFQVITERDPAIKTPAEVLLYPSFRAILSYRLAHKWYLKGHYFWARWLSQRTVRKTGIEIHPGATIGKGLFIDHGSGVIIGETTIIGDNVTLYQGVTLGGTGKEKGKRHPTLGDNVMVSAGAKILGSFTIGENSKIGAGSVVLKEVPPNCTVVGLYGGGRPGTHREAGRRQSAAKRHEPGGSARSGDGLPDQAAAGKRYAARPGAGAGKDEEKQKREKGKEGEKP